MSSRPPPGRRPNPLPPTPTARYLVWTDSESSEQAKAEQSRLKILYGSYSAVVAACWAELSSQRREQCLRAIFDDAYLMPDKVLCLLKKYRLSLTEHDVWKLCSSEPTYLCDIMRFRARNILHVQYWHGPLGGPGDLAIVLDAKQSRGETCLEADPNDGFMYFTRDWDFKYGLAVHFRPGHGDRLLQALRPARMLAMCVPRATGELVLLRQWHLIHCLCRVVEYLCNMKGVEIWNDPKFSSVRRQSALKAPGDSPTPLADVTQMISYQSYSCRVHAEFLFSVPTALRHEVKVWFDSRPEAVPDQQGRTCPVRSERFYNAAFLETIHNSIQAMAIWMYLEFTSRWWGLIRTQPAKFKSTWFLQELSNSYQLEFARTQAIFRRRIQVGIASSFFRRVFNKYDEHGNAHVVMKGKPEDLAKTDKHMEFLLRLCLPETTLAKGKEVINELSKLYKRSPLERDRLSNDESYALAGIAIISMFVEELEGTSCVLPPPSRKGGQVFVSRMRKIEKDVLSLRHRRHLSSIVWPQDKTENEVCHRAALNGLDEFIEEELSCRLSDLYTDAVHDSIAENSNEYRKLAGKFLADNKAGPNVVNEFLSTNTVVSDEWRTRNRRSAGYYCCLHVAYPTIPKPSKDLLCSRLCLRKPSREQIDIISKLYEPPQSDVSVTRGQLDRVLGQLGFVELEQFPLVTVVYPVFDRWQAKAAILIVPNMTKIQGFWRSMVAYYLWRYFGFSQDMITNCWEEWEKKD